MKIPLTNIIDLIRILGIVCLFVKWERQRWLACQAGQVCVLGPLKAGSIPPPPLQIKKREKFHFLPKKGIFGISEMILR